MKLGYFGIGSGPCADPDAAVRVAGAAEDAGFESLWTGEHVVLPDPQVPPSPVPPDTAMLDPVVALAFVAAATERVLLGTGIIIVPQRNPLVLAKQLASLDVLSGGRLLFGAGVGYLRPEFAALGVPFEEKGARTDEYLDAILALWTEKKPAYEGRFVSFSGVDAHPRPAQQPHPPLVIGGHSRGAFRRAVLRGNGWYGFFQDVDASARCLRQLEDAAAEIERPESLGRLDISITPPPGLDRDSAARYRDLGVDRLIPLCPARSAEEVVDFVRRTADELADL
ncbi:MAG: TIGR03619 family F420-dependent LLM class oxidoreductase [Proteobacteria bacterium]|nr:TIGR03619 family F420-dependent LLM class oxidoreductase [Pseudomonadota bacterium]